MDRRKFLAGSACVVGGAVSDHLFGDDRTPVKSLRINVDANRTLGRIPADFTGLGYEISSVAIPGLLSPKNQSYIKMVRSLGRRGVIRVGGNTSDYSSFEPKGELVSLPKGTVINSESLKQLGRFLDATGWKLIWGLNLGSGSPQQAVEEAQAVTRAVGDRLLAFEIGNEPDLFVHEGHRSAGYGYGQFLQEYRSYKATIRAGLPESPFAGPDVAWNTDWAVRFAKDEGHDLKLLTHHYYRGGASSPKSSIQELLSPDPQLKEMITRMAAASREVGIPFRIVETNSFSGGGKPGVSDTFGGALWMLDYMLTLAWGGAAGANVETGMNQLGFVSSYSPIMEYPHMGHSAAPDYYGMLVFAQFQGGERLMTDCDAAGLNATAYAVSRDGEIRLAILNKDRWHAAEVNLTIRPRFTRAYAVRLSAPSLASRKEITFGGASWSASGESRAPKREPITLNGMRSIVLPAGSAALVTIEP